jgi:hypothetical protein
MIDTADILTSADQILILERAAERGQPSETKRFRIYSRMTSGT